MAPRLGNDNERSFDGGTYTTFRTSLSAMRRQQLHRQGIGIGAKQTRQPMLPDRLGFALWAGLIKEGMEWGWAGTPGD